MCFSSPLLSNPGSIGSKTMHSGGSLFKALAVSSPYDTSLYTPATSDVPSNIVTVCNTCNRVLRLPLPHSHTKDLSKDLSPSSYTKDLSPSSPSGWVDPLEYQNSKKDTLQITWSHGLCDMCYRAEIRSLDAMEALEALEALEVSDTNSSPSEPSSPLMCSTSSQDSSFSPPPMTKVLVADDNELQRKIVKRMVERQGYDCDVASTGEQAVEMAKNNFYAVILLDCMMGGTDGWAAATTIRSNEQDEREKPFIVALTGLKRADDLLAKCREAGMDEVVQKPLTNITLSRIMNSVW